MVREDLGITMDKVDESVLGVAARVEVTKEHCTIVGDGSQQDAVDARIRQLRVLLATVDGVRVLRGPPVCSWRDCSDTCYRPL